MDFKRNDSATVTVQECDVVTSQTTHDFAV